MEAERERESAWVKKREKKPVFPQNIYSANIIFQLQPIYLIFFFIPGVLKALEYKSQNVWADVYIRIMKSERFQKSPSRFQGWLWKKGGKGERVETCCQCIAPSTRFCSKAPLSLPLFFYIFLSIFFFPSRFLFYFISSTLFFLPLALVYRCITTRLFILLYFSCIDLSSNCLTKKKIINIIFLSTSKIFFKQKKIKFKAERIVECHNQLAFYYYLPFLIAR